VNLVNHVRALGIARELYHLRPNRCRKELAEQLSDYGVCLPKRGVLAAARDAHAEAVDLARKLCRPHPDQYDYDFTQRLPNFGASRMWTVRSLA
jgi:hypothetical protein